MLNNNRFVNNIIKGFLLKIETHNIDCSYKESNTIFINNNFTSTTTRSIGSTFIFINLKAVQFSNIVSQGMTGNKTVSYLFQNTNATFNGLKVENYHNLAMPIISLEDANLKL